MSKEIGRICVSKEASHNALLGLSQNLKYRNYFLIKFIKFIQETLKTSKKLTVLRMRIISVQKKADRAAMHGNFPLPVNSIKLTASRILISKKKLKKIQNSQKIGLFRGP